MIRGNLACLPLFLLAAALFCGCENGLVECKDGELHDGEIVAAEIVGDGFDLGENKSPVVGECDNPWELPLIGGECLAIGPRGCPRAWAPELNVECDPGELLSCPDGLVLTEDEVACVPQFADDCGDNEIPLPGGGCSAVGPDWAGTGDEEPVFDYCDSGELALPGCCCAQLGPRACPKLWDPDAEVVCQAGEILPCPEGSIESGDGLWCEPVYDECGAGEIALPGGGCKRVIPLEEDCPPGKYAEAPDDAGELVYVYGGSQCVQDCGSEGAPFASLQEAVDSVAKGGTVLVGPGDYDGAIVTKPVRILGVCPAKARVVNPVEVPVVLQINLDAAGLLVAKTENVEIADLTVAVAAVGVAIVFSTDVSLAGVEVGGAAGPSLLVAGATGVSLERLWLHDNKMGTPPLDAGVGIWLSEGSQATAREVLVERALVIAVSLFFSGTDLDIEDSTIRHTRVIEDGKGGVALHVTEHASISARRLLIEGNRSCALAVGAHAVMTVESTVVRDTTTDGNGVGGFGIDLDVDATLHCIGCLLESNAGIGIRLFSPGATANLQSTVIRATNPGFAGAMGWGIEARKGTSLHVSGSLLDENSGVGMLVRGAGTEVEFVGSIVQNTTPGMDGFSGPGIHVTEGAHFTSAYSLLEGNTLLGAGVFGMGSVASLKRTVVRDTKSDAAGEEESGGGVQAFGGATLEMEDCLIERNHKAGITAFGPSYPIPTVVKIAKTVVRDCQSIGTGELGLGMLVLGGSQVEFKNSVLEGNAAVGVMVAESNTHATFDGAVIRNTAQDMNGEVGHGLQVTEQAALTITNSLIEGNAESGFFVSDYLTEVLVDGCIIRDSGLEATADFGYGAQAVHGAKLVVTGSLVTANRMAGLAAGGLGTVLHVNGCVISGTRSGNNGESGTGVYAGTGSTVVLSDNLIARNADFGIAAEDSGTEISVDRCLVRETGQDEETARGYGIWVSHESNCTVDQSLIDRNRGIGLVAGLPGTRVAVGRSVIRDTQPDIVTGLGWGVQAQQGAIVTVSGSLIDRNVGVGLGAVLPGTGLTLRGCIVRATDPTALDEHGYGVLVFDNALAYVQDCLLLQNATVGLSVSGEGTEATVLRSAVLETREGGAVVELPDGGAESQVFGDGLLAEDARMNIFSVIVKNNTRCGIYFLNSEGTVSDSFVTGNSSYGLAMEKCEEQVAHEEGNNAIFGNAFGLPPAQAVDITNTPGGLPAPSPPALELPE